MVGRPPGVSDVSSMRQVRVESVFVVKIAKGSKNTCCYFLPRPQCIGGALLLRHRRTSVAKGQGPQLVPIQDALSLSSLSPIRHRIARRCLALLTLLHHHMYKA